jgi:hypothetical protein
VHADRKHLHVDVERRRSISRGRRAHSAAPPTIDYDDEAYEITNKIDARGKMGEARNGITKDWAIIDVPPGTERVRMDGAGGAAAEVTWQKYSGVRRAKFVPERDERDSTVSSTTTSVTDLRPPVDRERRLSVHIVDKNRGVSRDREVDIEKITDRRISVRGSTPPPRRPETWTEITKDLVCREAIQEMNYEFEETEFFFYVVEYLAHVSLLSPIHFLSVDILTAPAQRRTSSASCSSQTASAPPARTAPARLLTSASGAAKTGPIATTTTTTATATRSTTRTSASSSARCTMRAAIRGGATVTDCPDPSLAYLPACLH